MMDGEVPGSEEIRTVCRIGIRGDMELTPCDGL